jgi:glycosyltransferase involved in cell wall biosynthesis
MAGLASVKVALLSDCFLPRLGGIEVQVHDLADHLIRGGHQVEVFTATPGPRGERDGAVEVVDGIRVHRMAIRLPFELPVNPFAPHEVRRRLGSGRFDVAHVHMGVVSPFATDMVRVALGLGLPTAVTWHCVVDRSAPVFRALGHARRWSRAGAALSAVSTMAATRVSAVAGNAPVDVLPNGIDTQLWAPPERQARTRTEAQPHASATGAPHLAAASQGHHPHLHPVRVVSALRLAQRKRPQALLEVLRAARELVPPDISMEAVIVGEGPQRPLLERFLDRHQMSEWVRLPGRVTREELRRLHWSSDVYVCAATLEAFGIAALEARTAGLPVVARAGTGVEDFVEDGVSGLVAATDRDMAVATARLATDHGLRAQLGAHNRHTPPAQDWTVVVRRAEEEYARAQRQRAQLGVSP